MASKKELVQGLNDALRYEYQAVVMYNTYAAAVSGIHRGELKEFFLDEIADELGHAELLANKVSALGEEPATEAHDVDLPPDEEAMLENVLQAESEAIERYTELMTMAEEADELGLANDLHDIVSDETTHKEETEKLLRGRTAR
jgi:bacterioferritin